MGWRESRHRRGYHVSSSPEDNNRQTDRPPAGDDDGRDDDLGEARDGRERGQAENETLSLLCVNCKGQIVREKAIFPFGQENGPVLDHDSDEWADRTQS